MTGPLIIFAITYFFIASEKLDKTVAALLGATVAIGMGYIPYEEALNAVDLNVILLLVGMMLVMDILSETGLFEWIAVVIAKKARGNGAIIFLAFLFVTAVLSAFLDNVTTVILIAPISILIAEILGMPVAPILILEAIASNIGGTSTLIGDPPNILIGSRAGLTFNDFLAHLTPGILIISLLVFPAMMLVFRRMLVVAEPAKARIERTKPELAILDAWALRRGLAVFGLILLGFFFSRFIRVEPGIVAIGGAILMSFVCRRDLHHAFQKVEWSTVFFFVGLFMLIGALEHNGLFERLGEFILELTGGNFLMTVLTVLWFSAIVSAIVDNIPLVIAMIPLIQNIVPVFAAQMGITDDPAVVHETVAMPLYWALALGACLGGNGTLVGASANVVVSQIARRNNYNLTFMAFTAYGFPIMIVTLAISTVYLYVRYFLLAQ